MTAPEARNWAEANVQDIGSLPDCKVVGWAGGYRSKTPPRGQRVATPVASHLMEGDVVVVCPELAKPRNFLVWTKGKTELETKTPNGVRKVMEHEVTAILTNDFFAALRPVRLSNAKAIRNASSDNEKSKKCRLQK